MSDEEDTERNMSDHEIEFETNWDRKMHKIKN